MKKTEKIITIAALILSLTAISAAGGGYFAPTYEREDEPVSSFEREYEYDDSDEPYILAEPDEPYTEIVPVVETIPTVSDIPHTGAEDAFGWVLPAAVMLCTGVLVTVLGALQHKKR